MLLSEDILKERRANNKCMLWGLNLDEYGNCIENPYHTMVPS